MNAADLAADIAHRWERTTAVDELADAIERGDFDAARVLARSPLVRSALADEPWTRLEVLACMGACGCANLQAEAIATVRQEPELVRVKFSGGQTLLHRAAGAWSIPFVEALLELGADVNGADVAGHPPLYHAGNRMPRPPGGTYADAAALVALFVKYRANLNLANGVKHCTPLHMAARRGNAALAEALLAHGANPEARDSNGETPLRRAVNCAQPAVARVLIDRGADRHSRCSRGRTPCDAARTAEMRKLLGLE